MYYYSHFSDTTKATGSIPLKLRKRYNSQTATPLSLISRPNSTEIRNPFMSEKASTTLPATVEKVIKPAFPNEPEKAQISVEGADHLYRELRIENTLVDDHGDAVRLKPGAEVEVTITAEPNNFAATDSDKSASS
jgi:hypothetical protein